MVFDAISHSTIHSIRFSCISGVFLFDVLDGVMSLAMIGVPIFEIDSSANRLLVAALCVEIDVSGNQTSGDTIPDWLCLWLCFNF